MNTLIRRKQHKKRRKKTKTAQQYTA